MLNKYRIKVTVLKSTANLASQKPRRALSNGSHTNFVAIKGHSNLPPLPPKKLKQKYK